MTNRLKKIYKKVSTHAIHPSTLMISDIFLRYKAEIIKTKYALIISIFYVSVL